MFRHLFKLMWNKKKQNFLLMTEMFVSFLVVFAVMTISVYYYGNYRKPVGMDYENVWVVNYSNPLKTDNKDSIWLFYEALQRTVKALPQVREVSFTTSNVPFASATIMNGVGHKGRMISNINWYNVDDNYQRVLDLKLLEGRWFNKQDAVAPVKPVVINATLREELFGNEPATGRQYGDDKQSRVIGVVQDVKMKGDYTVAGRAVYNRTDTASLGGMEKMLVRVTPDANLAFEGRLYKTISTALKTANVEIEHLTDKRGSMNNMSLMPMIILSIVAGFLIINVALGLFGVLWYNINKRRAEIGLRRAVGATGRSVSLQLITEALILSTFSVIAGVFFAVQFPLLNVFDLPAMVYVAAIVLSVLFIYLLVLICAFYPGRQAAAVYPAVALHED
ncbi:FtsX-like permease family protein [uncultured Chitinophaga sp.]|jgi:ABC-type antimicrobial peptide transport system, permease component|uniref:ABC transporter permease n=1 Tax=uncultured Chitinophaga sp. TaxID=339340 RepID=UPI00261B806A|nr:FtsX-like permease family protein [uncultured Chitinophaga sp.]